MRRHAGIILAVPLLAALWAAPGVGAKEPVSLKLEPGSAEVGRYEKVELRVRLNREYPDPFDPEQVDLTVELRTPTGRRLTIAAFQYQPYEQRVLKQGDRDLAWLYPTGAPEWLARFAPAEVGEYTAVARLRNRTTEAVSEPVHLLCAPSQKHGYLRASRSDPRFFELSDGTPFFAVGQDLAFIGPSQYMTLPKAQSVFRRMSENGANYARVWACCGDWAMAVEAPKSAWGRSWGPAPPVVVAPKLPGEARGLNCVQLAGEAGASLAVSPSQPVALRPDTRYVVTGNVRIEGSAGLELQVNGAPCGETIRAEAGKPWTGFRREFTTGPQTWWLEGMNLRLTAAGRAWLRGLSLREAAGGPELLWEADVDRPLRGVYNPTDCFMLDQLLQSAEQHGIYLQLCLLARDLYMGELQHEGSPEYERAVSYARRLFRYAVARWGYSTSVASWEYWNEEDPGLPTDRFYAELGEYLKQVDVYAHLRVTSAWGPAPKDWRHPDLDVADLHWYLRPTWVEPRVGPEPWKDEVASVADRARFLLGQTAGRPALLSEFGLADDKWGLSPYMRQDTDLVHFHNALWASALSGLAGTTMFWWWENLDQQNAYHHYQPLAAFVAGIPFTTGQLRPVGIRTSPAQVRAIGLSGKDRAYFWLFNGEATWWKRVVEKAPPALVEAAGVEIEGLAPGAYLARWWNTETGGVERQDRLAADGKVFRLVAPAFRADLACKVEPARG